ncbi:NACHT, LRR and PYD domains-containing protein 13 [Podochytrium sp. JEL0797]|nr:NACHT, LRR and PYD domains-containing protein 13 [Podochytrium sp. JEL0797]
MSYFELSKNPLGDEVIVAICEGITDKTESAHVELHLQKTNMGDVGVKAIASLVTHQLMALENLDISENDLTQDGIRELGNALMKMTAPTLKIIDLHDCGNGPEGLESIADAVKTPQCSVDNLNVSNCGLGDAGAALFLDHATASKVITLDLSDNEIQGTSGFTDVPKDQKRGHHFLNFIYFPTSGNKSLTLEFMRDLGVLLGQAGLEASKRQADAIEARWVEVSAQRALNQPAESDPKGESLSNDNAPDDSELPATKEDIEVEYSGFVELDLTGEHE